jgi:hypothetical protein
LSELHESRRPHNFGPEGTPVDLERELVLLQRLSHPNLAKFYGLVVQAHACLQCLRSSRAHERTLPSARDAHARCRPFALYTYPSLHTQAPFPVATHPAHACARARQRKRAYACVVARVRHQIPGARARACVCVSVIRDRRGVRVLCGELIADKSHHRCGREARPSAGVLAAERRRRWYSDAAPLRRSARSIQDGTVAAFVSGRQGAGCGGGG